MVDCVTKDVPGDNWDLILHLHSIHTWAMSDPLESPWFGISAVLRGEFTNDPTIPSRAHRVMHSLHRRLSVMHHTLGYQERCCEHPPGIPSPMQVRSILFSSAQRDLRIWRFNHGGAQDIVPSCESPTGEP